MKIKLELLSDALPGSGMVYGELTDIDITFDKYGFPYIPGKRIKGILKENARDLIDMKILEMDEEKLNLLFSKDFRLSNGYLADYTIYNQFMKYITYQTKGKDKKPDFSQYFYKSGNINYFAYIRAQTSIEYSSGVAKKHSLRFLRVLKKGLTFYFEIKFAEKNEKNEDNKEIFEKICKITRKFGTRRTRGFGTIKLNLLNENSDSSTPSSKSSAKSSDSNKEEEDENTQDKLIVELKNQEQILVANQIGNHDTTEYFIPGSTILGTIAKKFIEEKKKDPNFNDLHNDNTFFDIFLSGKVKFSNLYPKANGKIFYPSPLFISKDKYFDKFYDLTKVKRPEEIDLVNIPSSLVSICKSDYGDGLALITPNLAKSVEYHHARPKHDRTIGHATADQGQFFQYEVINAGQTFHGEIIGSSSYLEVIENLLGTDGINLTIGKSRSAQYGKCTLELKDPQELDERKLSLLKGNRIIITLLSDMILVNENGFITPNIEILLKELMKVLNIDEDKADGVNIEKKYLKYKKIGGFKYVWNLPKLQAQAISAGSELVIEIPKDLKIEKEDLERVDSHFFGVKTKQGYGQIKVNRLNHTDVVEEKLEYHVQNVPENLNSISKYICFCIFQRTKYDLQQKAHDEVNKLKKNDNVFNLSKSFIYRIKNLFGLYDNSAELEDIFKKIANEDEKTVTIEGIKHSIPTKFRDDFMNISNFIYFNCNEEKLSGFDSLVIEKTKFIKSAKFKGIRENIDQDLNKYLKSKEFELYKLYCNTLLDDLLYKK
ncbi:MAG: hypothetical protein BAJALOKI1v1_150018 [Promethearchaeota archaeon]|nr:MAG: hypothetical protein BAJALOKI1v1_150018 [Candidatus Lokiarchaeota archaeon]